jgi:Asp-tRNA(Asn)/Glu-tRNA(Gln) amidotransferase B subunit
MRRQRIVRLRGADKFGTKVELKNPTVSISSESARDEIDRQIAVIETGEGSTRRQGCGTSTSLRPIRCAQRKRPTIIAISRAGSPPLVIAEDLVENCAPSSELGRPAKRFIDEYALSLDDAAQLTDFARWRLL